MAEDLLLEIECGNKPVLKHAVLFVDLRLCLGGMKRKGAEVHDLVRIDLEFDRLNRDIPTEDDPEISGEVVGRIEIFGDVDRHILLLDIVDPVQGIDPRMVIVFASGQEIPALLEELQAVRVCRERIGFGAGITLVGHLNGFPVLHRSDDRREPFLT